ncbi:MAG: phage tail tape measure protein, partial [Clostridia bacterium]|nr:phage tail tape measure protein [Clostridia bacterium]
MAGARIKGITIEIGGDTTQLVKALRSADSAIKQTQTNLRDINKALKIDPANTNLLKDKQRELAAAISETKDKLQAEKEALEQMRNTEGFDANSQAARNLQTQIDLDTVALKDLEKQARQSSSVLGTQMQVAGDKIKEVGDKIKGVGDKIAGIGRGLTTTVTLPIVAAGTKMVSSFAEVDKTMTLTNATMNNTAEEADLLNKAMEEAASNSTFGMNEAAGATLNFARAGLTATEAANALAPAMNLAAGEAGDLDTVSGGLVATINGFGDSFEEAEHYADVFATACNNSALDVNSLSESMSVAAPIFKTAGKSVEDAALMLGVMANNGIEANVAANSLKTGMARLAQPTKQAREAMEQYGIAMSDIWNEDGSMKEMTVIQENLNR